MKKAQFKTKFFKNPKDFEKWLKETTSKIIMFTDTTIDLIQMHIHESGEILHCNAHAAIYNGQFVNLEKLKPGVPIEIWQNEQWKGYGKLIVGEITEYKEK